jgi:hypothetical protein
MQNHGERTRGWARLPGKLTYGNTMATIAVFLAVGGVGYAAADSLREQNRKEGRYLWSGRSYTVQKIVPKNPASGRLAGTGVYCDEFDVAIGGGYAIPPTAGQVVRSEPDKVEGEDPDTWVRGWAVEWVNAKPGLEVNARVSVRCADFLDLHGG